MKKLVSIVDRTLSYALAFAVTAILLVVVWQVVSRYLINVPSSSTEEIARFLLIWIGILGAAYAYRQKAHIGFNLMVERLSGISRYIALSLVELLVIIFCSLVMIFGGGQLVSLTLELNQISASLGIKVGIIYSVLPISGSLIVFYSLINIYNLWQADEQEKW